MRTFLLLQFLTCTFGLTIEGWSQAKEYHLADSIRESLAHEPRWVVKLETRNAFVTGRPVRTYGVKGGLAFGRRISFGLGYHWLRHGDTYAYRLPGGMEELRELRMAYVAAFMEYSFIARQRWEVTLPFVLGVGASREFRADEGPRQSFNRSAVVLYEPGIVAEYHFLRYFAAGAGVGVRLMLKGNQNIDQQFTAPLWELRFRVKLGTLLKDVEAWREE
jgi:hypothetical protein